MAGKNTAVFGIYRRRETAEQGVDALVEAGFRKEDISVLFPENQGTKDFGHEKHTKAPEGTATGATAGAIVGGTLGLLAGIGVLAIPGVGPFIAAGPIMATLSGIGAGGVVGGIVGALVGMGLPEYEAKRYAGMIREGAAPRFKELGRDYGPGQRARACNPLSAGPFVVGLRPACGATRSCPNVVCPSIR